MPLDVEIYRNGEKKGSIAYPALPVYRMLCEQMGYRTRWDSGEQKLHLVKKLQGRTVYLTVLQRDDALNDIVEKTASFLSETGVTLLRQDPDSSRPPKGDGSLSIAWKRVPEADTPHIDIRHTPGQKGKIWARAVWKTFGKEGFAVRVKADPKFRSALPKVSLRFQLPEGETRAETRERIAILLASALFQALTEDRPLAVLPYLPSESINLLLPFTGEGEKTVIPSHTVAGNTAAPTPEEPATPQGLTSPAPTEQAEVYFDYQLLLPESEDSPFLILGNLMIKNTGTRDLRNPVICLHATPSDGVQLKGRVVPPDMADTVAVHTADGVGTTGWKYLDGDWFRKAKERGEYWVRPIQPLRIPPGETETFSDFQISIPKPEAGGTVTVQGVVFFKEQDLTFPSINRITISF